MVIFMIVCCHGNSLQYTYMNEKEILDMWLIFIVNVRSLNPKLKQIVRFYIQTLNMSEILATFKHTSQNFLCRHNSN